MNEYAILAIDPSGTSTTAWFFFRTWQDWEIGSFEDEIWLEHTEIIKTQIIRLKVKELAVETGKLWNSKYRYTHHLAKLIKAEGGMEYLARKHFNILYTPVSNSHTGRAIHLAEEGKIPGLKRVSEQTGKNNCWEKNWYFKGKRLKKDKKAREHERDALMVFYIYWTQVKKREWPWAD